MLQSFWSVPWALIVSGCFLRGQSSGSGRKKGKTQLHACDKRVQNKLISTDCCISLVSLPVLCNIRLVITKTAMSILTGYLRRLCVFMQRVVDTFAISGLRYLRRLAVSKKKGRAADICSFWLDGGAVNSLKRRICNPETSAEHTNTQTTALAWRKKTSVLLKFKKKKSSTAEGLMVIFVGV